MEWKYVAGPAIAFILSLIAFVPLVKYRLKATEENTEKQRKDIQKNKDDNHRLELLIERKDNENQSKAMLKVAEALLLVAKTNDKFEALIKGQTDLIKKVQDTSTRAHERLDTFEKETNTNFKDVNKDLVSHQFLTEALKNHGSH